MVSVKKSKYAFSLNAINISQIRALYIDDCKNIEDANEDTSNTTRLSDLSNSTVLDTVSFLDESKCMRTCRVSMIDFRSGRSVNLLRYHCYWCKNPFSSQPIGCPIKYVPNKAVKKYHSHISQSTYTINENVTSKRARKLNETDDNDVELCKGEYYETDGVFCSFDCILAYILDNKHDRLYDQSQMLLTKMYNTIMGTRQGVITPAPHWRLLDQYGGHLSIVKFREGFNKIEYECYGITRPMPTFSPIGVLYEEKIKF